MNRRKFTQTIGGSIGATGLGIGTSYAETSTLYNELEAELDLAGYDGTGECKILAVISDPHIFLGTQYPHLRTERWDDSLINEINSLKDYVTDVVISGDLITYRSMTPGMPRYASHESWALEEYQLAKIELQRFVKPVWAIPGNHDTDAYEVDAEMFRQELGIPAYQKAIFGGVPTFFLNSGNGGMLDAQQVTWLELELATVGLSQEILIVAHHPSFLALYEYVGVKRILSGLLKGHEAPVWLIGGHNHSFAERLVVDGETKYIQMQVTTANPNASFSDGNNPGYSILAMKDGHCVYRAHRSLKDSGFESRPQISQMTEYPLKFQFEELAYPLVINEEGFYDRSGLVIEYDGVDTGCYIAYCKSMLLKITPNSYLGTISTLVISADIRSNSFPECMVSLTGYEGSWTSVVFESAKGKGLYTVSIDSKYYDSGEFFVKLDTELTGNVQGFKFYGWALTADETSLSGYDRWVLGRYGSLEKVPEAHPESETPNTGKKNIVNYAFNLLDADTMAISGLPELVTTNTGNDAVVSLVFAKMIMGAGVNYIVESSASMEIWNQVSEGEIIKEVLEVNGSWVRTKYSLAPGSGQARFYRVRVNYDKVW